MSRQRAKILLKAYLIDALHDTNHYITIQHFTIFAQSLRNIQKRIVNSMCNSNFKKLLKEYSPSGGRQNTRDKMEQRDKSPILFYYLWCNFNPWVWYEAAGAAYDQGGTGILIKLLWILIISIERVGH